MTIARGRAERKVGAASEREEMACEVGRRARRQVDARRAVGERGEDERLLARVDRREERREVCVAGGCTELEAARERGEALGDAPPRLVENPSRGPPTSGSPPSARWSRGNGTVTTEELAQVPTLDPRHVLDQADQIRPGRRHGAATVLFVQSLDLPDRARRGRPRGACGAAPARYAATADWVRRRSDQPWPSVFASRRAWGSRRRGRPRPKDAGRTPHPGACRSCRPSSRTSRAA